MFEFEHTSWARRQTLEHGHREDRERCVAQPTLPHRDGELTAHCAVAEIVDASNLDERRGDEEIRGRGCRGCGEPGARRANVVTEARRN